MTGTMHKIADLIDAGTRLGSLEVRLAETPAEVDAAQALRYRVFYEEMGAKPLPEMAARQRDFDEFDQHLRRFDYNRQPRPLFDAY